jgi:hypothetical protein
MGTLTILRQPYGTEKVTVELTALPGALGGFRVTLDGEVLGTVRSYQGHLDLYRGLRHGRRRDGVERTLWSATRNGHTTYKRTSRADAIRWLLPLI